MPQGCSLSYCLSFQPASLPPKTQTFQPSQLHNTYVVFQLLSHVRLFVIPWTAARQAFLSFTISRSLLKLMSIESVMPSNHFILSCPLLLLPSIFPSTRVSSDESTLPIRWPVYWSFSFSISPSDVYSDSAAHPAGSIERKWSRHFHGSPGAKSTVLPSQGAWLRSQVRALRSHMPHRVRPSS